jgi:murein DD-endopeptidase MepM/ murein hydrolase activator NlpD
MREQSYSTLVRFIVKGTASVVQAAQAVKNEIQAWLPASPVQRKRLVKGATATSVFSAVALAFATSQSTPGIDLNPTRWVAEELVLNIQADDIMRVAPLVAEEQVRRSDSLGSLLLRLGIADAELMQFVRSDATAAGLLQLRAGATVSALADIDGRIKWVRYWGVLDKGGESTRALLIQRKGERLFASTETVAFDRQTEVRAGEIKSSLYGATDAAGVPDAVANQMAEILSSQIDFYRDLKSGDNFRVAYESFTFKGETLRPGRIVALEFNNAGKSHSAYWFAPAGQSGAYYSKDGKSLKQSFLRSPLEFSRVTSGFTNARFHPILQDWRAHRGVDYGAPEGTRVRSTGDAIVDFVGQQNGYGNLVVLRHQGKYTTWYAHLSGFAAGVRKGARIQQGDVVGYVGQTGWATGPHLHYEFRINDVQQNPLTVDLPGNLPLEGSLLGLFGRRATELNARLATATGARIAKLD